MTLFGNKPFYFTKGYCRKPDKHKTEKYLIKKHSRGIKEYTYVCRKCKRSIKVVDIK